MRLKTKRVKCPEERAGKKEMVEPSGSSVAKPASDGRGHERSSAAERPSVLREVRPILITTIVMAGVLSLGLLSSGVVLVCLGASGVTTLHLFGQDVNTTSVGVVALVLCAITAVCILRRQLCTLEHAVDGHVRATRPE